MVTYGSPNRGEMVASVIDMWLDTYRAAGKAPGTIRNRRSYMTNFAKHISPLDATGDDLMIYLASRQDLKPESRKSLVIALRSFYRWAYKRGMTTEDLSVDLPSIHVPMGVPKPITDMALARARALADPETLLMLDLGALAGLRRSEIAAVNAMDVTDQVLIVSGKGGRIRSIPIHPRLKARLAALVGWAFPSPIRPGSHVSSDYVAARLEAVLPEPFTAHSLRHYFASKAYAGSHDIRAVQQLLGHASVETTQRYIAIGYEAMNAAVLAVA